MQMQAHVCCARNKDAASPCSKACRAQLFEILDCIPRTLPSRLGSAWPASSSLAPSSTLAGIRRRYTTPSTRFLCDPTGPRPGVARLRRTRHWGSTARRRRRSAGEGRGVGVADSWMGALVGRWRVGRWVGAWLGAWFGAPGQRRARWARGWCTSPACPACHKLHVERVALPCPFPLAPLLQGCGAGPQQRCAARGAGHSAACTAALGAGCWTPAGTAGEAARQRQRGGAAGCVWPACTQQRSGGVGQSGAV